MKCDKRFKEPVDLYDYSDFMVCNKQEGVNKKAQFENFYKEEYSKVAAKYTFLSSQQIKKKISDMWKRNLTQKENSNKQWNVKTENKQKGLSKTKNSKYDCGKQFRPPSRGKVLIPLNVDVIPTRKGALKSVGRGKSPERHVSFNNDPEIRYRTASSEASSNSTFISNTRINKIKSKNTNSYTQKKRKSYSRSIFKITKEGYSPMSDSEKNFNDLLNDKCSWSYKTLTINLETNQDKSSLFQPPNAGSRKHSVENDSLVIDSTFDANDSGNIDQVVDEPQKSTPSKSEEKIETLPKDSNDLPSLPYKNISDNECRLGEDRNLNDENPNDTSIDTSVKQSELYPKAVTDYSSSDDEVVLQTRIYNEDGKQFSNIPEESSNHSSEHLTEFFENPEYSSNFCNDNSDEKERNRIPETVVCPSRKKEDSPNLTNKHNNQILDLNNSCQKNTPCFKSSFSEKKYHKYKSTAETSSFELSSMSESDEADDEMVANTNENPTTETRDSKKSAIELHAEIVEKCTAAAASSFELRPMREPEEAGHEMVVDTNGRPTNEIENSKKSAIELHAGIIKKCNDISSECHSICDDLEMNENSLISEIEHDFFNGTLDINRYEINKKYSKNTTGFTGKYEKEVSNKVHQINDSKNDQYARSLSQEQEISDTDSDEKTSFENVNKKAKKKILRRKQNLKQKENNTKSKNNNDNVQLTNTTSNRNQTSNKRNSESLNKRSRTDGKIVTKVTKDILLDDGSQNSKFSIRNKQIKPIMSCDFSNDINEQGIENDNSLKSNRIDFRLIYSKERKKRNQATLEDVKEAVPDTFFKNTTPKLQQKEFMTDIDEKSEYYNFGHRKNSNEQRKRYSQDRKEITTKSRKIVNGKNRTQCRADDNEMYASCDMTDNSKEQKDQIRSNFVGTREVTNRNKSLSPYNLNKITNGQKQKHEIEYFARDISLQGPELEEEIYQDLSFEANNEMNAFNYSISKVSKKARSSFLENENCLLEEDELDFIQPEDVTKNKRSKKNWQFGPSKVEQPPLIEKESGNKKFNLKTNTLRNKEMSIAVKDVNMKKKSKSWDKELENLFSYEIISEPENKDFCLSSKITSHENYSNCLSNKRKIGESDSVNQRKTQVVDINSVNSVSLKNKYDNSKFKQNKEISSKLPQRGQNGFSLVSPSENIINKAMQRMEMCTLPYSTSCQERENTWMNDTDINEDSSSSPRQTEYSYSIKEIQSTILFASRNSLNSTKTYENFIQTGKTKGRVCKIEQRNVLKKNYKQESKTKSKETRSPRSPVGIKLNKLQSTPKNSHNSKYKACASKETTKDNTKDSVLGTILERLELNINSCNIQRSDNFGGDNTKTLAKTKKLKTKQATPTLKNSVSPEETNSLNWTTEKSPRKADAYYNLRKRKCKNPEEFQVDDFQNNQCKPKKIQKFNTGNINRNCVKVERSFLLLKGEHSLENNVTLVDSGSDYLPRQSKEKKELKPINRKNSKMSETIAYSPKKKIVESGKKQVCRKRSKFRGSLNDKNASNVESEDDLFTIDENKQNSIEKEIKTRRNNYNLVKNPQISIKIMAKNVHSNLDNTYISRPNFPNEQKSSSKENPNTYKEKCNYMKYLENVFKNKKTFPLRKTNGKEIIVDSDENEELFSLSSSDSDDNEESQKNRCTPGLLDSVLADCEEE